MRFINRLSVAAALGVIALTAACSDSTTGTKGGPKAGTLAQHFDTLYAQAHALSLTDINYLLRSDALSDLELAAAFGASPTNVTVTTSAGKRAVERLCHRRSVERQWFRSPTPLFSSSRIAIR